jgi:hypothetical protein
MKKIFKYPLEIMDQQTVAFPDGAEILSAGLDAQGKLCIWARVDPEAKSLPRQVFIVGTGNPYPDEKNLVFIASVLQTPFVWHIFFKKDGRDIS